jgi:hypothetical protein
MAPSRSSAAASPRIFDRRLPALALQHGGTVEPHPARFQWWGPEADLPVLERLATAVDARQLASPSPDRPRSAPRSRATLGGTSPRCWWCTPSPETRAPPDPTAGGGGSPGRGRRWTPRRCGCCAPTTSGAATEAPGHSMLAGRRRWLSPPGTRPGRCGASSTPWAWSDSVWPPAPPWEGWSPSASRCSGPGRWRAAPIGTAAASSAWSWLEHVAQTVRRIRAGRTTSATGWRWRASYDAHLPGRAIGSMLASTAPRHVPEAPWSYPVQSYLSTRGESCADASTAALPGQLGRGPRPRARRRERRRARSPPRRCAWTSRRSALHLRPGGSSPTG